MLEKNLARFIAIQSTQLLGLSHCFISELISSRSQNFLMILEGLFNRLW